MDNLTIFQKWFKDPIEQFQKDSNAGFITVISSIPLLERYLREKSKIYEGPITDEFYNEFMNIFPTINKQHLAKKFWEVFRHGLMHQCSFKTKTNGNKTKASEVLCEVGLNNDELEPIKHYNNGNGDSFIISPEKFSNKVIRTIENDFSTFEAKNSPNHPLSKFISWNNGISGYSGFKQLDGATSPNTGISGYSGTSGYSGFKQSQ